MLASDIWDNQTSARILRLVCHRKIYQIINGGKLHLLGKNGYVARVHSMLNKKKPSILGLFLAKKRQFLVRPPYI